MTGATRALRHEQSWHVFTASARGAIHDASSLPNQDAVGSCRGRGAAGESVLVLAAADGHGNRRHFRSAVGARFAVEAAIETGDAPELGLAQLGTSREVEERIRGVQLPALLRHWRAAVDRDVAAAPFSEDEVALQAPGDDTFSPYGSTVLVAVVSGRWCALAQIGDGDIVAAFATGEVSAPVPGDPLLDGQRTTSLCQPDAVDSFRVAVLDLWGPPLAVLLLATDGYGNAQAADPWEEPVSTDILRFVRRHGPDWVGRQLTAWVSRCASAEGSGDDTSVALLLNDDLDTSPHLGP